MATYVKATEIIGLSSGGSVSVTSTAGNTLICVVGGGVNNAPTGGGDLTVSGGGTWTAHSFGPWFGNSAGDRTVEMASCPNATGGTQSITITESHALAGEIWGFILEFSGMPTSSILDAGPTYTGSGSSTPTTTPTTGSLANSQAAAVFVSFVIDFDGANPSTITGTGSGWTYPSDAVELNGSTRYPMRCGYKVVSSVASQQDSWTINSTTYGAAIASFKDTATAAVPTKLYISGHRPAPFKPGRAR